MEFLIQVNPGEQEDIHHQHLVKTLQKTPVKKLANVLTAANHITVIGSKEFIGFIKKQCHVPMDSKGKLDMSHVTHGHVVAFHEVFFDEKDSATIIGSYKVAG